MAQVGSCSSGSWEDDQCLGSSTAAPGPRINVDLAAGAGHWCGTWFPIAPRSTEMLLNPDFESYQGSHYWWVEIIAGCLV